MTLLLLAGLAVETRVIKTRETLTSDQIRHADQVAIYYGQYIIADPQAEHVGGYPEVIKAIREANGDEPWQDDPPLPDPASGPLRLFAAGVLTADEAAFLFDCLPGDEEPHAKAIREKLQFLTRPPS